MIIIIEFSQPSSPRLLLLILIWLLYIPTPIVQPLVFVRRMDEACQYTHIWVTLRQPSNHVQIMWEMEIDRVRDGNRQRERWKQNSCKDELTVVQKYFNEKYISCNISQYTRICERKNHIFIWTKMYCIQFNINWMLEGRAIQQKRKCSVFPCKKCNNFKVKNYCILVTRSSLTYMYTYNLEKRNSELLNDVGTIVGI